ncbi:TetR/AcrR family transcriptional regulator [Streptomyces sp. NPDC001700]
MEAVLEAAMLLFWEQGYEATSLAQLRETTGLSSASLYGAFGSKEGLFEKAVEHYIAGPGTGSGRGRSAKGRSGAPRSGPSTHQGVRRTRHRLRRTRRRHRRGRRHVNDPRLLARYFDTGARRHRPTQVRRG